MSQFPDIHSNDGVIDFEENQRRSELNKAMDFHRTEETDVSKRIATLLFSAHAGAIVALPSFLKEIAPVGLTISVLTFMIGIWLSLQAFLSLRKMLNFYIKYLSALKIKSYDKAENFVNLAGKEEHVITNSITYSLYLFIFGFVVTVFTLNYLFFVEFLLGLWELF
jgi:hypothetical protein